MTVLKLVCQVTEWGIDSLQVSFLSPYFHHQHTEHFVWMGNVTDCLLLASAVHTHKHFGEESRFLS